MADILLLTVAAILSNITHQATPTNRIQNHSSKSLLSTTTLIPTILIRLPPIDMIQSVDLGFLWETFNIQFHTNAYQWTAATPAVCFLKFLYVIKTGSVLNP